MSKTSAIEKILKDQDSKQYRITINSYVDGSILAYSYSNSKQLFNKTNSDYLKTRYIAGKVNVVLQNYQTGEILQEKTLNI
jgi:hypothetical protein